MPPSLPGPGRVVVHVIDPALVAGRETALLLSAAEEEQAARFRFEKDARHWRACRAALRRILGQALGIAPASVVLELGEYGKPLLSPPFEHLHFNLSHCRELALVALGYDGPLGVDIEAADRGRSLLGCEHAFCHPDEIAVLAGGEQDRAAGLLHLWTRKEALLKALGTGMSLAPETVSMVPPGLQGAGTHPRLQGFRLERLEHPRLENHFACIAVPVATREILLIA